MLKSARVLSAAGLALAILGGASASAATFVDFTKKPGSGATNVRWIKNNTSGRLITGGASATQPVAQAVIFNFQEPDLLVALGLFGLQANFVLDGAAVNSPAMTTAEGWTQAGVTGTFAFTLNQALTPTQIAASGCQNACTNLLSGSFTNGIIKGLGNAGSFTVADSGTQSVSFTSDFLQFPGGLENMTLTLGSVVGSPSIGHLPGKALNTFKASATGSFGSDPGPTGYVPEPATWGLMIMGFLGAGAMIRRRRASPAAA
ncbi:MAG: PEP-CTERM sorting domain-containing protein [Phenylobacterium sp.]|uniref:PEP-CTERM sorting domain-containing protein n=1 Tax=Phenylobacterium sp. TaxID=1871053 RepID=UPI001A412682|nr:PEP-CTERM sorting domain-containing protein [Phenylobacterium sp.]MBL8770472.1 PEP-CTERM sorting domain-containing protein [Phenylobacterium sp.]